MYYEKNFAGIMCTLSCLEGQYYNYKDCTCDGESNTSKIIKVDSKFERHDY